LILSPTVASRFARHIPQTAAWDSVARAQDFVGGGQDFAGAVQDNAGGVWISREPRRLGGNDLGFCGNARDNGGRLQFNPRYVLDWAVILDWFALRMFSLWTLFHQFGR
jgi:hypothetical protein